MIAEALVDLTALLRPGGEREDSAEVFLVLVSRGDAARTGGGPDRRELEAAPPRPRDIFIPDLALGSGIKYRRGVSDDGQNRTPSGAPKIGRFAPITAIPPTRISA